MSDTYQAVYDAVRSRIGSVHSADIMQAVERAFDISLQTHRLQEVIYTIEAEMTRPSVVYRPSIAPDGNKWSVLLGDNLMEGVCAFGDTPAEAMAAFDKAFREERTPAARLAAKNLTLAEESAS